MRGYFGSVAMLAASALSAPLMAPALTPQEYRLSARTTKRQRQAVASGSLAKRYRSRAAQAKPKKRPNRNLISKRVRRKHRRAA